MREEREAHSQTQMARNVLEFTVDWNSAAAAAEGSISPASVTPSLEAYWLLSYYFEFICQQTEEGPLLYSKPTTWWFLHFFSASRHIPATYCRGIPLKLAVWNTRHQLVFQLHYKYVFSNGEAAAAPAIIFMNCPSTKQNQLLKYKGN